VVPVEYAVTLHIDPRKEDFHGVATIAIQIRNPVTTIWLHGVDLSVSRAELLGDEGRHIEAIVREGEYGLLGLHFNTELKEGPARIHIEYQARMGDDAGAIRRTIGGSSDRADFVFTTFEPMDARRVFPCFDEPRFKVPWQLSLIIPEHNQAFSNTRPIEEQVLPDGTQHVRFAKTRPLPSYLVAFAVGLLDAVEVEGAPARTRILVRSGRRATAQGSAGATAAIFERVQQVVGAPIPYSKHDLVFVPGFPWGGMEHPGLIAVREGWFPSTYGGIGEDLGSSTIAHELAHLWFGDLVTMAWWDDIWLSEGLARWASAEFYTYSPIAPAAPWRTRHQRYELMRQDAISRLPAIRPRVTTPEEVRVLFGLEPRTRWGRTWEKAPFLLDMVEQFVGKGRFQAGLQTYLRAHADSTATTADFATAMSRGAGMDLCDVFSTFVAQQGIPLVQAQLDCEEDGVRVLLSQRPDRRENPVVPVAEKPTLWSIPVCIRYPQGSRCVVLSTPRATIRLPLETCPSWIFPNRNDDGYYWYELGPVDLKNLVSHGVNDLSARELFGLAHNLRESVERGTLAKDRALATIRALMNTRELEGQGELHWELGWVFHQIESPRSGSD